MNDAEVRALDNGDEVYWNDPDDGACSRYITIQTVTIHGDVVRITGKDGCVLECFAEELNWCLENGVQYEKKDGAEG